MLGYEGEGETPEQNDDGEGKQQGGEMMGRENREGKQQGGKMMGMGNRHNNNNNGVGTT